MHTAQIGTTFIFARYYTKLTRFVAQGPRASQGILFIRFDIIPILINKIPLGRFYEILKLILC